MSEDHPPGEAEARRCECGRPEKWAQYPEFPVEFNAELNEYYLVFGTKQPCDHIMRYCFSCGGRLPESRRGELFTDLDESEMAEVRALTAGAKSAAEVLRVLGEPDATFDCVDGVHSDLYNGKKWDKCYRYSSRWNTLVVNVMEFPDGSMGLAVHGHYLGPPGGYRRAREPGHRPWWKLWG